MTELLNLLMFSMAVLVPQTPASAAPASMKAVFEVNGDQLTGTTTFAVDKSGKVSGQLKLTTPMVIDAELAGRVTKGTWTFAFPFTMQNHGVCKGTMSGTGKVTGDGESIAGSATLKGHCDNEPVETWAATFTFKASEKR